MQLIKYKPAKFGLGTESSQNLQPLDFAPDVINRFYNLLGDLEKRPGLSQLGPQITSIGVGNGSTSGSRTPCSANINNLHEYIDSSGNSTLFASGVAETTAGRYGNIWRYNAVSAYWEDVLTVSVFGIGVFKKSPDAKLYSVQMNDKLIFCNGIDRNFYIDKPAQTVISAGYTKQLFSTVTKGTLGGGTGPAIIFDADVSNWRTQTNVAINDLLYYGANAAIITSVGTSSLDITPISLSANGMGVGGSPASGSPYRIVDLVELNIISQGSGAYVSYDNVAIAGSSTSANAISVTALNFSTTDIRKGDYVYNTTRGAVTQVVTVTSNIAINEFPISGQVAGDSLVFLKDSMPIASYPHVHYGRLHLIDSRDPTKIRVSGPNDPEDFTTFSKTLTSISIDYGARQPRGDVLLTMDTFQRYLVVGGQQAVYVTDGTSPIADVTADVIDLDPVGLFPQGVVSTKGLRSIGNEMLYIGRDGLRSFLAAFDSKNTTTNNKSEQIKSELIAIISDQLATPDNIQLTHYQRRNWIIMKVGDNMYNYNYTPTYQLGEFQNFATITRWSGLLAEQDAFLVRRNGTLITADSTGRVYEFDTGATDDNGVNIYTSYTSPWHTLQEGASDVTLLIKDGRYIKPVFETYGEIEYTISVVGDYSRQATDSIVVTAQGAAIVGSGVVGSAVINNTAITDPKMPLRWRGEQFQVNITTDTPVGADIINSYTIYGNVFGRK